LVFRQIAIYADFAVSAVAVQPLRPGWPVSFAWAVVEFVVVVLAPGPEAAEAALLPALWPAQPPWAVGAGLALHYWAVGQRWHLGQVHLGHLLGHPQVRSYCSLAQ
jgi:hypothetical protein